MGDRPADASRIHLNSSQCVRRAEVYFALALQWPLWLALRTPRDDPEGPKSVQGRSSWIRTIP